MDNNIRNIQYSAKEKHRTIPLGTEKIQKYWQYEVNTKTSDTYDVQL
jgi:hypothetical protein